MTLPQIRRYSTGTATGTNNQPEDMKDLLSGEAQFTLFNPNVILDVVNDPDPTSGVLIKYVLLKNGIETPVQFFSSAMNSSSAGRVAQGPVNMSAGQYKFVSIQYAGTAEAKHILVKYANPLM